jgi:hypothetical protein
LIEERAVQSRVREMAIVLSSAEEKSLPFAGKCRRVMARSWWRREPKDLLEGFSEIEVCAIEGSFLEALLTGGAVEMV